MTTVESNATDSNESTDRNDSAPRRPRVQTSNRRVTARVVVDGDGETHTEYTVEGVAYGSLSALQRATGGVGGR